MVWYDACYKGQPKGAFVTGLECGQGRFLGKFLWSFGGPCEGLMRGLEAG